MSVIVAAAALATLIQTSSGADDVCYDRAVVGYIRHADHFVDLNNFLQPQAGVLMWGGRMDVDIEVEKVLAGPATPKSVKARVVLTDLFSSKTPLMILLKEGPVDPDRDNTVQQWKGRFIPRASREFPWRIVAVETVRSGVALDDPSLPPQCSKP